MAREVIYPGIGLLPLHPHNGVLQVWLEMGAVGRVDGDAAYLWNRAEAWPRSP